MSHAQSLSAAAPVKSSRILGELRPPPGMNLGRCPSASAWPEPDRYPHIGLVRDGPLQLRSSRQPGGEFRCWIENTDTNREVAEATRRAEQDPLLTREHEVLRLSPSDTIQEIAKKLYFSVRTAETHRAHIMQKLRDRNPRRTRQLHQSPRDSSTEEA